MRSVKAHEVLPEVQRLYEQGDYETAEALCAVLEAEERKRKGSLLVRALRARGVVNIRRGKPEQALRHYEEALAISPDDPEVHFSLALYYLSRGDYRRGFAEYEWRTERPACIAPGFAERAPLWDGTSIPDRSLMIHCEQGAGDAIQCVRLLPLLKERVGTLYLACHDALHRLFEKLPAPDRVFNEQMPLPAYDFQLPLLSIPHRLGLTLAEIPSQVPYLEVPATPPSLTPRRRPRVGLVWRAKPHEGDYRTAPLAALGALAAAPVDWVSLQKDPTPEERTLLAGFEAEEAGSGFGDFHDTAEKIATLDLVISVDTSVVHLAGALAKPVWVLLPKWAEWRWLIDRADSPWYPTARLFRQETDHDWAGLARTVAARLGAAVQASPPNQPWDFLPPLR